MEQTGISGEFWFFSQLHRLGYEAYITFGNTKGIDISVKLNDRRILTFEVKSLINFGGMFRFLGNIMKKQNHFAVFVNLNARKQANSPAKLLGDPKCYIVQSKDLDEIAHHWNSVTSSGYGFEAKLLPYLKHQESRGITELNISNFKTRHNIEGDIDFGKYNRIIWTLEEFETKFFRNK